MIFIDLGIHMVTGL